jgi:hypothetical protein
VKDPSQLSNPALANQDSDGNPNNDGYHEMLEMPVSGHTDPFTGPTHSLRLPMAADYRVAVNLSGAVTVYQGRSDTALPANNSAAQAIVSAMNTSSIFGDAREKQSLRLTHVNIAEIKTAIENGVLTDNNSYRNTPGGGDGISIYFIDNSQGQGLTGNTSVKKRGFKLVNGARLPQGGLTITSVNPIYIQGDYNTGRTNSQNPASNQNNSYNSYDNSINSGNWNNPSTPPSSSASGYTRKPAAIVADAINVLSNSSTASSSSSGNTASSTTINAALVSGNRPTTLPAQTGQTAPGNKYSGGLENFPRLHEGWGGKFLTIRGSLGQLFSSQQSTGYWANANYGVPNRRWFYDNMFLTVNPPGFPPRFTYQRGMRTIR